MKELNDRRLKIMERLRDTMKEANDWKDEVEENSYLWLDDRKEHMRQFLLYGRTLDESELENREQIKETPPNLSQFQNQIDLFNRFIMKSTIGIKRLFSTVGYALMHDLSNDSYSHSLRNGSICKKKIFFF